METRFVPSQTLLGLAAASLILLTMAFGVQYFAGAAPCELCIWQRWPHVAVIGIGLLGWSLQPQWMLGILTLVFLSLIASVGLAAYHVAIEQGWMALPAGCLAGGEASSIEELKAMLSTAGPTCDQVAFTILGLSLAAWNLVASLALSSVAAFSLWWARSGEPRCGSTAA